MTSDDLGHKYEQAVLSLQNQVAEMRGVGTSAAAIARAVHAEHALDSLHH